MSKFVNIDNPPSGGITNTRIWGTSNIDLWTKRWFDAIDTSNSNNTPTKKPIELQEDLFPPRDFRISELLQEEYPFGGNEVIPSKKNIDIFNEQRSNLEDLILRSNPTDSNSFNSFEEKFPGINTPVSSSIYGAPIYRTPQQKDEFFYNTIYQDLYDNLVTRKQYNISEESLNLLSPTEKRLFVQRIVADKKLSSRGIVNDTNYNIINTLSPQGKVELANSNYLNNEEISHHLYRYTNDNILPPGSDEVSSNWLSKIGSDVTWSATLSPFSKGALATGLVSTVMDAFNHPYSVGFARNNRSYRHYTAPDAHSAMLNYNANILQTIVDKDNERKSKLVRNMVIDNLTMLDYQLDLNPRASKENINDIFNKVAEHIPYYKGIIAGGGDEFDDYNFRDKKRFVAKYMALNSVFGSDAAISALSADMQNWVSDHQTTWDCVSNSLLGFTTEFVATIGNTATALMSAYYATEGSNSLGDYLTGEKENIPFFLDPTYYEGIRSYNVFSPTKVDAIRSAGGISPSTNIRPAGEELRWFHPYTLGEALEQGGQMAGSALTAGIVRGGASKLWASVPGAKIGSALEVISSAVGSAQAEAVGTFSEATEGYENLINDLVYNDFEQNKDQLLSDFINTPEYESAVTNKLSELNSDDNYSNWSEDRKKEEAAALVQNQYIANTINNIKEEYADAYNNINKYAASAYATSFFLNIVKTSFTNASAHKWMFGSSNVVNSISPRIIGTYTNNKLKTAVSAIDHYGLPLARSFASEFNDEALDEINNKWGLYTGLDAFSRYVNKRYDTEAFMNISPDWFTGFLSSGNKAFEHLYDEQTLYAGFLGGISGAGITPNLGGIYRGITQHTLLNDKEIAYNTSLLNNPNLSPEQRRARMINLTLSEKLGRIFGGGMSSISEVDSQIRNALVKGSAIAESIQNNWDSFMDYIHMIGTTLQSKDAQHQDIYSRKNAEDEELFNLVRMLSNWGNDLKSMNLDLDIYNKLMKEIIEASEGTITEEQIDAFLNNPANTLFLQNLSE